MDPADLLAASIKIDTLLPKDFFPNLLVFIVLSLRIIAGQYTYTARVVVTGPRKEAWREQR